MKKLILLLAFSAFLFSSCANPQSQNTTCIIEGTITGDRPFLKEGIAIVSGVGNADRDTAAIVDGKFRFELEDFVVGRHVITVKEVIGFIPIFIEKGAQLKVEAPVENFRNAVVTGGKTQDMIGEYNARLEEVLPRAEASKMRFEMSNPNISKERSDEICAIFNSAIAASKDICLKMIEENPGTYFALHMLVDNKMDIDPATYARLGKLILSHKDLSDSPYYDQLKNDLK